MLLSLLLLPFVAGKATKYVYYGELSQAFYACAYLTALTATFCESNFDYVCFCHNEAAMATLAGCLAINGDLRTSALKKYVEQCKEGNYTVGLLDLEEAHQNYLENAQLPEAIPDFNALLPVDVPVKLNATRVKLFKRAYKPFLGNYDDSLFYGVGLVGYWLAVALVAMLANWTLYFFPNSRIFFNGKASRLWRKYVTLPALVRRKRATSQRFFYLLDFLVPSRLESLVTAGFMVLCIILNRVDIYYVEGDPIFADKKSSLMRYVGDRTGIICTVLIPLLVLFGGRNNIIMFLTRWKYSTMMVYHRWIARAVALMAFIHSIAYTRLFKWEGDYSTEMKETYLVWGTVGTACGVLICFQALLFFRRRWYELFLWTHILLAIFFIVGTWYHVWELGYAGILYASFAVWGLDRLLRLCRIASFGLPKARILLVSGDTLRVEVTRPSYWKPVPGGHAWLTFVPSLWKLQPTGALSLVTQLQPLAFLSMIMQLHPFTFVDSVSTPNTIVFLCKVKNGVTQRVAQQLAQMPGQATTMSVAVEGPYGEHHRLRHSSAVFIAGGNGIPGLYSAITDLAKQNTKQVLKLIWIVREQKALEWFAQELEALNGTRVEVTVYVTKSTVEDKLEKAESSRTLLLLPNVTFVQGRPQILDLVAMEIEAADSVAFVTCGHPAMVDEVRYQVVRWVDQTTKRVDFFEEIQVWA